MVRKNLQLKYLCANIVLCTALCLALLMAAGCTPRMPGEAELARFQNAGPVAPAGVELNEFLRARVPVGPYRVVPGDLLALEMPDVLRAIGESLTEDASTLRRRVRSDGMLRLPGLEDDLQVKGMTVPEIEHVVEQAYAKSVLRRPAVVVFVVGYETVFVTVEGQGITSSGQYELRSNERSVSALLMKAGGIAPTGAESITVWPADGEGSPLVLPVRDGTVPLDDVILAGGERVEVAPALSSTMTIVGQVGAPGRYGLDPTAPITLIEALSHAGGVRELEDPRYVSIFRQDADGNRVSARFCLHGNSLYSNASIFHDNKLGDGAFAMVKPGDVIVVERTVRSRARQLLARSFHVSGTLSASSGVTYFEDLKDSGSNRDDRAGN